MSFIEVKEVSFTYNPGTASELKALDNVSFSLEEGEFLALVGRNGSGKSTLAKLINGLLLPDEGSVTVDGMDTADKKALFEIRSRVGVVFQNPDNQMIATIIEDDVAFGPENLGLKPAEIRERVDKSLASVGMAEFKRGTPFRLSGGQKQRVAIAGVLAIKPRVMILDESTSMLDPEGREEVMAVVERLNKEEKMGVIMITHFMEEAAAADKLIVMDGGKIAMAGGKEIFERAKELEAAGLALPPAAKAAYRLRQAGVELTGSIVTDEQLAEALCRLK